MAAIAEDTTGLLAYRLRLSLACLNESQIDQVLVKCGTDIEDEALTTSAAAADSAGTVNLRASRAREDLQKAEVYMESAKKLVESGTELLNNIEIREPLDQIEQISKKNVREKRNAVQNAEADAVDAADKVRALQFSVERAKNTKSEVMKWVEGYQKMIGSLMTLVEEFDKLAAEPLVAACLQQIQLADSESQSRIEAFNRHMRDVDSQSLTPGATTGNLTIPNYPIGLIIADANIISEEFKDVWDSGRTRPSEVGTAAARTSNDNENNGSDRTTTTDDVNGVLDEIVDPTYWLRQRLPSISDETTIRNKSKVNPGETSRSWHMNRARVSRPSTASNPRPISQAKSSRKSYKKSNICWPQRKKIRRKLHPNAAQRVSLLMQLSELWKKPELEICQEARRSRLSLTKWNERELQRSNQNDAIAVVEREAVQPD